MCVSFRQGFLNDERLSNARVAPNTDNSAGPLSSGPNLQGRIVLTEDLELKRDGVITGKEIKLKSHLIHSQRVGSVVCIFCLTTCVVEAYTSSNALPG